MRGNSVSTARRFGGVVVAVVVLAAVGPATARADQHDGTVTASVTATEPAEACLLLSSTSLDYGSLEFGTTSDPTATYDVTNCSTEEEGVLVSGTDAANGDETIVWALDSTVPPGDPCPDLNTYQHLLQVEDPNNAGDFSNGQVLTTGGEGMRFAGWPTDEPSRIQPSDSRTVRNQIVMPCPGSDGAGVVMTMSVVFTAMLDNTTG